MSDVGALVTQHCSPVGLVELGQVCAAVCAGEGVEHDRVGSRRGQHAQVVGDLRSTGQQARSHDAMVATHSQRTADVLERELHAAGKRRGGVRAELRDDDLVGAREEGRRTGEAAVSATSRNAFRSETHGTMARGKIFRCALR